MKNKSAQKATSTNGQSASDKAANTQSTVSVFECTALIFRVLLVAIGHYVFSKGNKPKVTACAPFTASERKSAKSGLLILSSDKGEIARSVIALGDRFALSKCPSTGLDSLIGLESACHSLPSFKLESGARFITDEQFRKQAVSVTFKRNGLDATALVLGYDAKKNPPQYLAALHTAGKSAWAGQVESKALPTNARELAKSVQVVTA